MRPPVFLNKLYRFILIAFFLPFFGGFVLLQRENIHSLIIAAGIVLLFILCFRKSQNINYRWMPFKLFLAVFLPRFIYCSFVKDHIFQISDFQLLLEHAQTGVFTDNVWYYSNYLHKIIYPLLLHVLHISSQNRILLFQCICLGFGGVIIYCIAQELGNCNAGIVAVLLYAFWPAQIVYTQIVTEEHMAVLLLLSSVWVILRLKKEMDGYKEGSIRRIIVSAVVIGVILGLIMAFKDWGSILICAMIIGGIYLAVSYREKRKILILAACMAVMLLSRTVVHGALSQINKYLVGGAELNPEVITKVMFETLDPDCSGGYDVERNREYYEILERYDNNYKLGNREARRILFERIRNKPEKMPALLIRKGVVSYANDMELMGWAINDETEDNFEQQLIACQLFIKYIDRIYYCLIVLLMLVAVFMIREPEMYFILLSILGGGLISLLIECQNRYKYSIEPLWCIPAAFAICWLVNFVISKSGSNDGSR